MIQRAVTAIIGVVIGLFVTFAVFETIIIQLDNLYLMTQDTCNVGTENKPIRTLKLAHVNELRYTNVPTNAWPTFEDVDDWRINTSTQALYERVLPVVRLGQTNSCTFPAEPVSGYGALVDSTDRYTPSGEYYDASGGLSFNVVDPGHRLPDATWLPAENVFAAQKQLVVLLAVIAAIGMPVGAMTAIIFFGQAVISSGVSGQGSSQVLVAIAAVVVILVAVQMFQQFTSYLGDAFDSIDSDRFAVFNEPLGQLAVTIAEFWGVLAFAGLINIATIVWRNYGGSMNIGGQQGGL